MINIETVKRIHVNVNSSIAVLKVEKAIEEEELDYPIINPNKQAKETTMRENQQDQFKSNFALVG